MYFISKFIDMKYITLLQGGAGPGPPKGPEVCSISAWSNISSPDVRLAHRHASGPDVGASV